MADPTEPQDYSSKIAEARLAMHTQQPKKMALQPSAVVKYLWIDDLRLPPDDNWLWAKSSKEALSLLGEHPEIGYIAFDFDLGESDTAMPVLLKIKEDAVYGRREPPRWNAHTANPVGRNHIETIMSKAMDYWAKHSDSAN